MRYLGIYHSIKILTLIAILIAVSVVYGGMLYPITPLSYGVLVIDGLITVVLYSFVMYALNIIGILKFPAETITLKNSIPVFIRFTICVIISIIITYCILFLSFSIDVFRVFVTLIPLKAGIGMLVLFAIMYKKQSAHNTQHILEAEEENPDIPEEDPQEQTDILQRITVKSGQKIHVFPVENIEYIQAEGDYVMIYTTEGKYIKDYTMKYLQSHLCAHTFVRIHRSYIVNIHAISSIQLYEKQNYSIILKSGASLRASTDGYKKLKHTLQM